MTEGEDTPLADEVKKALRERFDRNEACKHCLGLHARACPRVKRLSYHPNGGLKTVQFWKPGTWPTDDIIWPEDVTQ